MQQHGSPAPEDVPAAAPATCSVESTSPDAAVGTTSFAGNKPRRSRDRGHTPLPTRLTPKMQNAIRIFSTGVSAAEACTRSGVAPRYFRRVMNAPIGTDYFKTITARVESSFIDKAAAVAASDKKVSVGVTTVQNEIDEAVLESVQELRSIVKASKSDQARALAAKELLDLAQAKKRYMAAKTGEETDIELGAEDIAAYAAATTDLRKLHLGGTLAVLGEELRPPVESSIVRTIEAAVDPETLAQATRAIDQVSATSGDGREVLPAKEANIANDVAAENARPDGRSTDANQPAPVNVPVPE